jgi:hypothetical protein
MPSQTYYFLGIKMRKSIVFLMFLIAPIVAQEVSDQKIFRITEARFTIGKYEISIKHQHRTIPLMTQEEFDNKVGPTWCAAFLQILDNGTIIDRLDFPDIHTYGWIGGLFLPVKRESPRHFIITKYGDYDCRTIIITDNGEMFNLGGGSYRIFQQRYLISPRELPDTSGGGEFSIFDLLQNKVIMSIDWNDLCGNALLFSYTRSDDFILRFYSNGTDLFAGIVSVNIKNWQVLDHTQYFYRIDFDAKKLVEALFDNEHHQEFVIDQSNIDLNHLCECIKNPDKH